MLHEETGQVVRVEPERAWVRVEASSACASCASTKICGMTEEGFRVVEVLDPVGVQPDQEVGIEVEGGTLVAAALLMYGLPLALLLAGLAGGHVFAVRRGLPADWVSAGSALGAMALGFLGLYLARGHFAARRTFYPTITRITASAAEVAARPASARVNT